MLIFGDCLEEMAKLPVASVDLILCDLPYGTTQNKWDRVIDLKALWAAYWRVAKPKAAVVLLASQPFTTTLISSELKAFRYCLVWDKIGTTGFQTAKVMPLRRHEDVVIFYRAKPAYNPKMETRGKPRHKGGSKTDNGCYGELRSAPMFNNDYYPTSIIQISNASKKGLIHPTQKPVALMEYLIRTYSNEGDVVMDNCFGSCTTGVACLNTGQQFIGIERDLDYFRLGLERFYNHVPYKELFI
jgi:site-specific DNA-methyltransferase (adenine-specific)